MLEFAAMRYDAERHALSPLNIRLKSLMRDVADIGDNTRRRI